MIAVEMRQSGSYEGLPLRERQEKARLMLTDLCTDI